MATDKTRQMFIIITCVLIKKVIENHPKGVFSIFSKYRIYAMTTAKLVNQRSKGLA